MPIPSESLALSLTGIAPNSQMFLMLVPTARCGLNSLVFESLSVILLGDAAATSLGTVALNTYLSVPQGAYQVQTVELCAAGAAFTRAIATEVQALSLQVTESEEDPDLAVWTKEVNDSYLQTHDKKVVRAGKFQFRVNSIEHAWVSATENLNPKLGSATGFRYLVGTATLGQGKNSLFFYQEGNPIRKN